MIKMTLNDGTEVEFAGINGTNFIVPNQKEMDTSVFTSDNLKSGQVVLNDGQEIPFQNLSFIQQQKQLNGDYYICFEEKSAQELREEEIRTLLVQLAEIEVSSGDLALEDIPSTLQDEVRVKLDDDKWIDK